MDKSKSQMAMDEALGAADFHGDGKALKAYFFQRNRPLFAAGLSQILTYAKHSRFKTELDALKMRCDRLLQGIMVYDEEWDMERCPDEVQLPAVIDWQWSANGDPEWMWMLNRQRYFTDLVRCFSLTKETKYIECFFDWIEQWIEYHTEELSHYRLTSCRTLDIGIRLKNWCVCLDLIFQQPELMEMFDDELLIKIIGSIHDQVQYLMSEKNLSIPPISNWKILEMNGVIAAAVFLPEMKNCANWLKKSITYTNLAAKLQINPDGLQWEQSFMYHHEVFLCLLEIFELAKRSSFSKQLTFENELQKMLKVSIALTKPDGKQSPVGDSDEEEMAGILTKGALVLEDAEAKFLGEKQLSLENMFFYGYPAIEKYEKITAVPPSGTKTVLADSGLVFLKDTREKTKTFTMLKAGPQGGGHGHCDLLHLEIQADDDCLLSDSGRYTYLEGSRARIDFKKASAHNVCTIDNRDFTLQDGSWTFKSVGHSLPIYHRFSDEADYIEAAHLGYMDEKSNVFTQRKLYRLACGIWAVIDYFHTQESHLFQQHFHFPAAKLEALTDKSFVYQGKEHRLFIDMSATRDSQVLLRDSCYSPRYNERFETKKLVHQSEASRVLITVLSLDRQVQVIPKKAAGLDRKAISGDFVSALQIIDGKDSYLLATTHLEDQTPASRKVYVVDEDAVYGRAVLLHKLDNEVVNYQVLKS